MLRKPYRYEKDVEILKLAFENIAFFQNLDLPKNYLNNLIKLFDYEYKERGDILFKFDDFATNYYILLSGSAYLLVPKNTLISNYKNDASYITEPNLVKITNINRIRMGKGLFNENPEEENLRNINEFLPDFQIIKTLQAVMGFGEIALRSNLKR